MCLIIQRPANKVIEYNKFKTALDNNPDGFGLSIVEEDGSLITIKDAVKPDCDKLYGILHENLKDKQMLIHFRYTTAGKTMVRNSHPFPVLEKSTDGVDLRVAHNGTLTRYKTSGDESDTRKFVRTFVRPLFKRLIKGMTAEQILQDKFIIELLEGELPGLSVLSFIDGFGNTLNVNALGNGGYIDNDGIYYSNKYSFDPDHRTSTVIYPIKKWGTYDDNDDYNTTFGYGKEVNKADKPTVKHASDTLTQRFSDKFELNHFDEVLCLTDNTIEEIVKKNPDDAVLLIKELIDEYAQANKKVKANG